MALVDTFSDTLESRLRDRLSADISGISKVDLALRVCLETFGQYRSLAKIALVQATGLGTAFEEKRQSVNQRFISIVGEYLEIAVEDGSIPPLDTEIAACAWVGALNEIVLRWVFTGEPDPERSLPALRRLFLKSVGVPDKRIHQMEKSNPNLNQTIHAPNTKPNYP